MKARQQACLTGCLCARRASGTFTLATVEFINRAAAAWSGAALVVVAPHSSEAVSGGGGVGGKHVASQDDTGQIYKPLALLDFHPVSPSLFIARIADQV